MNEEEQRSVVVRDDAEIAWSCAGSPDGLPIVFIHGGAMDGRMWDAQVEALSPRHRVVICDLRGHGRSRCEASDFGLAVAARDVLAVMDTASISAAVLVGHSMGASVAQLIALDSPERVSGLIGVGAACMTMSRPVSARLQQALNPLALRLMGQARVRAMFAESAGASTPVKEYASRSIEVLSDDMFAAVMRTGFGTPVGVAPDYRLATPLLLIYGDREPYRALIGDTTGWVARDAATVIIAPDAAHNANQDAPDAVNRAIEEFVAGLPERGSDARRPGQDSTDDADRHQRGAQ
jgi:3-oxoadipate enol-lactonase